MEELLCAFDSSGALIKIQERVSLLEEIMNYSLKHGDANLAVPVVHLNLADYYKRQYIEKRSDKPENPYLWDLIEGHVKSHQTHEQAVVSEGLEEMGIDIIIVEPEDYEKAIRMRAYDLKKKAVVRQVDENTWSRSVRIDRDTKKPWNKRDNLKVYCGRYDGKIELRDGEVKEWKKLTLLQLYREILRNPNAFGYDIKGLMKYAHLLS